MTDRRLLEALRRALLHPLSPPDSGVERLRRLVHARAVVQPMTRAGRIRQIGVGVFAGLFAMLGMGGVAVALGPRTSIGAAVRNVAHDVGLPVDSGRLADARDAVGRLRAAIDAGESDEVEREATVLKRRLSSLDADEQRKLADANGLLQAALPAPDGGSGQTPAGTASALTVEPANSTLTAGVAGTFTVHRAVVGSDAPVLTDAALSIAPDGSCNADACVATVAGPHTVTATRGPATGSSVVTVLAGPVDHVVIAPPLAPPTAGLPAQFTLGTADVYGNPTPDIPVGVNLAMAPDGTCSETTCTTTKSGPHTVSADLPSKPLAITIGAGPLQRISLTPQVGTAPAGTAQPFVVDGFDSFDNPTDAPAASVSVSDGACDPSGCSASAVGVHRVTAVVGELQATATLQVVPASLANLTLVASPSSLTAGTSTRVGVEGFDRFGNDLGDLTSLAPIVMSPDGVCDTSGCSTTVAGPHRITTKLASLVAGVDVDVLPGAAATVQVAGPSDVQAGTAATYTVHGFDQYGNSLGDVTAGSGITISPDGACQGGTCSATVAGRHVVSVTFGAAATSTPLGVAPGPVDHLLLSPGAVSAPTGSWQDFTAEGFDQYGNDLGDLTSVTRFGVSPEGRCSGNSCSADVPGRHTVTGWDGDATGTAEFDVTPGG